MIYFMRHGQTEFNQKGLWMGRLDLPLNARGVAQVEQAAVRLAHIPLGMIITSPLGRARESAQIVATRHPEKPPITVAGWLTERDYGRFEGLKKNTGKSKSIGS